ncbi:PEP-utilizing enzyme [Mycobacterium sp. CVI_P3]|uniref:Pyruvate, phosphate dikinase n=1 Tax=Mycobacterium pinniadriaticum TaxID=2994102 RepID=A0ABT3SMP9_9MYCO|nr:putative PEP-binding protein [Mycobacterium pinniadriaticum]MCX2934310.1 PEP-utilizing enzyme [Mycobacterium pinniadriaticum]MCX2940733.1 PEP-utilizing enzyme [Mycobacterium pinniadriaticum]
MTPVDYNHGAPGSPAHGAAARIRALVERVATDKTFNRAAAVASALVSDIDALIHRQIDTHGSEAIAEGVPASPGAATGRLVVTAEAALDAADEGDSVILIRDETGPEDVLGMRVADGIVTTRGGTASHAAVIARGWGIPAIVGMGELTVHADGISISGRTVPTGTVISVDGTSGQLYIGSALAAPAMDCPELDTLLAWADEIRGGRIQLRVNADDATSATEARARGAEGVGLCRSEHMFFADDRLPLIRRLLLTGSGEPDSTVVGQLEDAQQQDFEALLTAMDGLPVCVRLLDPPAHEFLSDTDLDAHGRQRETNPMMGVRGIRLAVAKPWIYPMQLHALTRAVDRLRRRGLHPRVEVMIPLVMNAAELRAARSWVKEGADFAIGTMIETPRAAIMAETLAFEGDFVSFGTNDLTQLTLGLSRDDAESELLPSYFDRGLLVDNPFIHLDEEGVGFLIHHAVANARKAKPEIKIGVCGEHAGDPRSAGFLIDSGVDYLSCSPYRLPALRLTVAQHLLGQRREPA